MGHKKNMPVRGLTCVLAFCSLVYELLLAQGLSAFLSNTVLRYSVTIGLYMCSLGLGALFAEGRVTQRSAVSLFIVEILLAVSGGFSIIWLYLLDASGGEGMMFLLGAHALIILIGVLSGMEIPLLMAIANRAGVFQENVVLGFNYAGAFMGTMVFAFIFYPRLGLFTSAFLTGTLNAIALFVIGRDEEFLSTVSRAHRFAFNAMGVVILAALSAGLVFNVSLSRFFMNLHLG